MGHIYYGQHNSIGERRRCAICDEHTEQDTNAYDYYAYESTRKHGNTTVYVNLTRFTFHICSRCSRPWASVFGVLSFLTAAGVLVWCVLSAERPEFTEILRLFAYRWPLLAIPIIASIVFFCISGSTRANHHMRSKIVPARMKLVSGSPPETTRIR